MPILVDKLPVQSVFTESLSLHALTPYIVYVNVWIGYSHVLTHVLCILCIYASRQQVISILFSALCIYICNFVLRLVHSQIVDYTSRCLERQWGRILDHSHRSRVHSPLGWHFQLVRRGVSRRWVERPVITPNKLGFLCTCRHTL